MALLQSLKKALLTAENWTDRVNRQVKRQIQRNTDVTIMPYIGYGNQNQVRLRGRVLENHRVTIASDEDSALHNLQNIIRRFNSDELAQAALEIRFKEQQQVVTTDEEGFFYAEFDLAAPLQQVWHKAYFTYDDGTRHAQAEVAVRVAPPDAQYAVISDMDDTVIRSNVPNRVKLLANTLFKNAHTRLPFPGVAEFYSALQLGTHNTCNPIYYVSNSPYNLYDLLHDFFEVRGIPQGPIFLRDFGLSDRYIGAYHNHKADQIKRLLDLHPNLPFILIGDSGEHDADIYAEFVRHHPGRIAAIYIRNVRPDSKWKVNAHVKEIAQEMQTYGVDMLLVRDTLGAASHALAQGYIPAASLTPIERAVVQDLPSNPIQALMDNIEEAS